MFKEFKTFILRGNVMDMAVGIIIGSAFVAIVNSLVEDIVMPPIGLLLGGVDFSNMYLLLQEGTPGAPYPSLAEAQAAGAVTINYGVFLNALITFLIIALVVFLMIRLINQLTAPKVEAEEAPTSKECPFCLSEIHLQASRCPQCTSQLENN
jgi:large conductance mechanosensitive channel